MGAAGAAGAGDALNVENVFSTHLYEGTGANRTITNGIDLSTEGGLVWINRRGNAGSSSSLYTHFLYDTERGVYKHIRTYTSGAESSYTNSVTAFNTDGFDLGVLSFVNAANDDFVAWTFRKAPKFFDIVTYTGNGTAGRTISHNLGSAPACIIVKGTSSSGNWWVYHKDGQGAGSAGLGVLNSNAAFYGDSINDNYFGNGTSVVAPTSTVFTVGADDTNINGKVYVAYLFAHNDGDGEFGPTGDQDIIKCGSVSYTQTSGATVDLGFEPAFVITKPVDQTGDWVMNDEIRGMYYGSRGERIDANNYSGPIQNAATVEPTATGFEMPPQVYTNSDHIYIAIRRGPMAVPTDSSEVFAIDTSSSGEPWFNTSFKVDSALVGQVTGTDKWYWSNRKTDDKYINPLSSSTGSSPAFGGFYYNTGFYSGLLNSDYQAWMWARATGFFDVVSYTGNGTHSTEIKHNLGAAPEMIIFKNLDYTYSSPILWNKWYGYNPSIANSGIGDFWDMQSTSRTAMTFSQATSALNADNASATNIFEPTDTSFWVGNSAISNRNGDTTLALVFASLDGVSKVGTYTGNSNNTSSGSQVIDCGFSNGTKFVFIKPVGGSYNIPWFIFDTTRGINTGSDNMLEFNSNNVERTWYDWIDQDSSGFVANNFGDAFYNLNTNNTKYMFYAVAA